jgi:hypothetical protein NreA
MKQKQIDKQDVIIALKKAKSHIETIITMLDKGEYCVDIMQQNLAVIGLLKSAHSKLMENHLHTCFMHGMNSDNTKRKEAMIDEINALMRMGNK